MTKPNKVPIGPAGYKDMIQKAVENWHIELQDGVGAKVIRLGKDDARCELVSASGTNPVDFRITLTGEDVSDKLPVQVERVAVFIDGSNAIEIAADYISPALLYIGADKLVVQISIEVPEVKP